MSFFKNLFGGKKEEAVREVTVDNLQKGDTVSFPSLYTEDLREYHDGVFTIEDTLTLGGGIPQWLMLKDDLWVKKNGKSLEIIRQFADTDDFVENVDMDVVSMIINAEDDYSNDIPVTNSHSFLVEGDYKVQKDTDVSYNGTPARYIEAKTTDSSRYIYIIILESGETFIFESVLKDLIEFSFF